MNTVTQQTTPKNPVKAQNAIALLRADHKLVSSLFSEYEKTQSITKKQQIVSQICTELVAHAKVEEEIFYPAVRRALKDKKVVPEAMVEQAVLKALIAQVQDVEPHGEIFDAKIKVISEYVAHHVKREQNEMFPKAKAAKLDMLALGAKMSARKAELLAQQSEGDIYPDDTEAPYAMLVPMRRAGDLVSPYHGNHG